MTAWEIMAQVTMLELVAVGQRCTAHRNDNRCTEIAEAVAWWPSGAGAQQCPRHLAWWLRVADELGFVLHTTPLEVRRFDAPPPDDAATRFSLLELDR